jgi:hypothetical protein
MRVLSTTQADESNLAVTEPLQIVATVEGPHLTMGEYDIVAPPNVGNNPLAKEKELDRWAHTRGYKRVQGSQIYSPMTSKEFVLSRFPQAVAFYRQPVYVMNQKEPLAKGAWVVQSNTTLGAEQLGTGQTEEQAWSMVATTIRARAGDKRLSFREWLAKQAEQEGSVDQRRQMIEDWKDAVAQLGAQVIRWLAEEDVQGVLTVQTGMTQKEEEGLGPYDIAALRIYLASRFVDLVPVGRNVVGGIGPQGDLGFRAEGRVDMQSRTQKYMLYHVASGDGKRWVIVDDDVYAIRDLDKATFIAALQDLLS